MAQQYRPASRHLIRLLQEMRGLPGEQTALEAQGRCSVSLDVWGGEARLPSEGTPLIHAPLLL